MKMIEALEIVGGPSAESEPSERALHDPALGQHDEAVGLVAG